MMLAAFYTIQERLYPDRERIAPQAVSYAPPPEQSENTITYNSGTEFSEAVARSRKKPDEVWAIMDELMETLHVINPRLYGGVMRKIEG